MSRIRAILLGVAGLLLLTWLTVALRHEVIESDLEQRVEQSLAAHAIAGLTITADGRDLRLDGEIARTLEAADVAALAGEVWGVHAVDASGLVQRSVLRDVDDPLHPRIEREQITRLAGAPSSPLDAVACQHALAQLASSDSLRFERGRATPMVDSYPLLNQLAAVVYRCPQTQLRIGAHSDTDDALTLNIARARAEAVERIFFLAGVPASRMQIVVHGASQAAVETPDGGALSNHRMTFDVFPVE